MVIEGNGNNGEDKTEGFRYKNTIGTYLHGPLLTSNNNLCNELLGKLVERKNDENWYRNFSTGTVRRYW